MGRTVTLVLVDGRGAVLGALPPYEVPLPWWPEVEDVVAGARERYGVDVRVLRFLAADRPIPHEGHVSYVAEVPEPPAVPLAPFAGDLPDDPRRAAYAEPGGPDAAVRWAVETLARLGTPDATATQVKTWNLSAIWRLASAGTPVAWLKQVPGFFAHEGAVLRLLGEVAPGLAPPVLATGPHHRHLLGHVPGEDRFGADAGFCAQIAADYHPVQAHFAGRTAELTAAGVPDGRPDAARLARVAAPYRDTVDGLAELIDGLPDRLAAADACGLPDTLVHGDLHPGNVRADERGRRVIIDWGDSTVGPPAYDILRLAGGLDESGPVVGEWARRWRETVPGSDPERAVALLAPVAELRAAAVYAGFLDRIEPSEWPYHAADVPDRLRAAVTRAGTP